MGGPCWDRNRCEGRHGGAVAQLEEVPGSLTWSLLNSSHLLRTKVLLSSDQHTEKVNICLEESLGASGRDWALNFFPPSLPPYFLLRSTGTSTYLELLYLHQSYCTY